MLTSHLEASLLDDDGALPPTWPRRSPARALVQASAHATTARATRTEAPSCETRPGWAWLRVMRRYDEYERASPSWRPNAPARRSRR